ncbi:MAG: ATP synthase F1 subunit delta [Cyclobacteriaceae bacterium]|nr:ATP synthase F1 subunit delta [Cyclobacteriaceae bacterium]
MSNYRIAKRYARSLVGLSIEKDRLEEVMKDMDMLNSLCIHNRDFILFLKNPIIHSYQKLSILKKIFKDNINDMTFKFIDIVTRKSRENVLPEIAAEFLDQYRKYRKIEVVEVTTPIKLDKKLRAEFANLAKNHIGKEWKVELVEKVDEELIGGYIVKIGDRQIDNSVSSKLREIKQQLLIT